MSVSTSEEEGQALFLTMSVSTSEEVGQALLPHISGTCFDQNMLHIMSEYESLK